jgi:O-methyltransferase
MQGRFLKKALRSVFRHLGYDVVKLGAGNSGASLPDGRDGQPLFYHTELQRVREELAHCQVMRGIHRQDVSEIEELYRTYLFADLPRRDGRARELSELIGTTVSEAIYLVKHLHDSLKVPGDICEFGVAQGATSKLLAAEILPFDDRRLWLFDSFEGLPAPSKEDRLINDIFNLGAMEKYQGTMASPHDEVLGKLATVNFPSERTKIKKGWIKDTVKSGNLPAQIAFAYIDFDFHDPIKEALDFVDARMPAGGRIVVDDYGFFSAGAQLAVDRFAAAARDRFTFALPLPFAGHFCILSKVA